MSIHYYIYEFLLNCCIIDIIHDAHLILMAPFNIDFTCIIKYLKIVLEIPVSVTNKCFPN